MDKFNYYTPTKVVFGKDAIDNLPMLLNGYKKVLIHYGGQSAKKSGLLDKIIGLLEANKIAYVTLGGVVPNPRLSKVYEAIELCKKENVDFILAVGGGSVIDSAKAIGYGLKNDGDVWDFYIYKRKPQDCLALGVILTNAAAGSEMSDSSVITNDLTPDFIKHGCNSDYCRATFAIMDPSYTITLSPYTTACGLVDILMHTMERYFNRAEYKMEVISQLAEGLMRSVIINSPIIMNDPTNYNARADIMWASSLSHNGLMGEGSYRGDWSCHQIEHELSAKYDIAHGAGLSCIFASWARYVYQEDIERFARFARNVLNINEMDDSKAALLGIEAMEAYYKSINMPTSLKEAGIDASLDDLHSLAYACSFNKTRTIGCVKKLAYEDIYNILKAANN